MPSCQNCKTDFTIAPEDFAFYEKIHVPPPTFCPDCRLKRRLIFQNQRIMHRRKCDATGAMVFSFFRPDSPIKRVYEKDYWWSDAWDAMGYGRDYDFSRPFFAQFKELMCEVPWFSRSVIDLENSDYCMNAGQLKDCYLVFNSNDCERCYYGNTINDCKDCFDCTDVTASELCFGCTMCYQCYQAIGCVDCEESHDIFFSRNLRGCHDCFGCVGLRKKSFCFFNEQLSHDEYFSRLKTMATVSHGAVEKIRSRVQELYLCQPAQYYHGRFNEDSTGEYIYNAKNTHEAYRTSNVENCKHVQFLAARPGTKDSYDYTSWGMNAELIYESSTVGISVYDLKFCFDVYPNCSRLTYAMACPSSSDLFGCVGLKKKQYCILNKQYSKSEYEALVAKIRKHMEDMPYIDNQGHVYKYGEFFPPEFSPFAYNEALIQDYYPLEKEEAMRQGYIWYEPEDRNLAIDITAENLPDTLDDVDDSITGKVIGCAHKGSCSDYCITAFKILPQELAFYRKMKLPLPRLCFSCRHKERLQYKSPMQFFERTCNCAGVHAKSGVYTNVATHDHGNSACPRQFKTTYAPERPEIVYCEECYQTEVV